MEKGGERWSKPHVATLSLHSLMELKTCIEKGTILLDLEASTLPQVVGTTPLTFFSVFLFSFLLCLRASDRDGDGQSDRERAAEGGSEGEGHVHAAPQASPPDQEIQPALARRHRQKRLQRQQAFFKPGERYSTCRKVLGVGGGRGGSSKLSLPSTFRFIFTLTTFSSPGFFPLCSFGASSVSAVLKHATSASTRCLVSPRTSRKTPARC